MMIDKSVMQQTISYPAVWKVSLVGAVLTAAVLKLSILAAGAVPFNADEAIVALMARHILAGEHSLFFYGQAYMGSLDAYLVAGVFQLFGAEVWGIRLVQILLYSGALLSTAWLGRVITGKWQAGVIAAWFLAVPTVSMSLYTTVSMGGYGEMLLIGNLILLLTIFIVRGSTTQSMRKWYALWFGLGFLSGFGLWVFGLTLVYSLPALLYLAWLYYKGHFLRGRAARAADQGRKPRFQDMRGSERAISTWGILLVGLIAGALPWLYYAMQNNISTLVVELGGGAIAGVEGVGVFNQILHHALNFGLFGLTVILGLRPSWEVRWLALPLAPVVLSFWVLVAVYAVKKVRMDWKAMPDSQNYSFSPLLAGVVLTLVLGFIFSPFGADPSGRYFLPISVMMALFAAQAVGSWMGKWGSVVGLAAIFVLLFNLWGTFQTAHNTPPGLTTQIDAVTQIDHSYDQELIEFLRAKGEKAGYTNYWVAYPLAFLSGEDLIYLPRLPYHRDLRYTDRDDRYAPYREHLEQIEKVAYISTHNPLLDDRLRSGFESLGVSWQEHLIGDYRVYYDLSSKVTPEQLGLSGGEG